MNLPGDLPAPASDYLRAILDADLRLLSLADRLRQHWTAHAAASGLTGAQVKVLLALSPGEAAPMRELAARLDYDASNLTTLAERLRTRGLVGRDSDTADRRVKTLALTEAGRQAREKFWAGLTTDPGPLAQLSEHDAHNLARLLQKIETTT